MASDRVQDICIRYTEFVLKDLGRDLGMRERIVVNVHVSKTVFSDITVHHIRFKTLGDIVISAGECGFSYRTSIFDRKQANGEQPVILSMKAALKTGDREKIAAYVAELRQKRTASQPLDVPSAGSTFKRPEGYFAAKLIEDSGLKGFALDDSGAQVSPKHAGFVVNNNGAASAEDILRLINYVSDKVYMDSGVRLEKEVRLIGEFGGEG